MLGLPTLITYAVILGRPMVDVHRQYDERIQWVQILEVDTQLESVLILSAQPADGAWAHQSVYDFRLMVMNTRKAPNNIVAD